MTGKVLVTDGNQRSTLALTRSLGKRGIRVTVCDEKLPCLASVSKYCASAFSYPSPLDNPDSFIEGIIAETRKTQYDLLIPMTDITSFLIGENRNAISPHAKISMPDWESYKLAIDKGELISLCRKLDIPAPATEIFTDINDIIKSASEFKYPVIIKPRKSVFYTPSGTIKTGVGYAYSKDELIEKLDAWDNRLPPPLIQERITGPSCGAFLLFREGREIVAFFHKRIREKPPSGGVSVLRESIPSHPQMLEYAVRLLKHLNWNGVAMAEFKVDDRDNTPKLMEINARFWGSLQLAIDSGIDFPYLLYEMEIGGKEHFEIDCKTGIRTRWFLGDLDHMLSRLFKKDADLNLPPDFPGRLSTFLNFLVFYHPRMKYEIIASGDMAPFFFEFKSWLKDLTTKKS